MESNFLRDLIQQAQGFKQMKQEMKEGKMPDVSSMFKIIAELPTTLEKGLSEMSEEDRKKVEPLLDQIKKQASPENIFKSIIDADNSK